MLTDRQLAEIEALVASVIDQGMVDDLGDPIALAAAVPALLAEARAFRRLCAHLERTGVPVPVDIITSAPAPEAR